MDIEKLSAWARKQGRPFTYADARAAGFSRRMIEEGKGPVLHDLGRGLLVSEVLWGSSDARMQHRLLTVAVLLRKQGAWLAARRSAAVLHGLPLRGGPPDVPQLVRDPGASKVRSTSRHERIATVEDSEITHVYGARAVNLARTVHDIAREETLANGLIVADAALRRGLAQEDLVALAKKRADWPGGMAAVRVAALADGLHETALESLSWAGCVQLGIPLPVPQVRIYLGDRLIARVDGLWEDEHTVGQADGLLKYNGRKDVIHDKLQDERLEDAGLEVVRWGWKTVDGKLDEFESKLRRGFERGRRQDLDPRLRFERTTLKQSLQWTGLIAS